MRLSQCRFLKNLWYWVILDGYGYREEQQDNAIFSAKTPVMDALWANRPHTLIDASGLEVGLPDRQMGNSEVGHVNLGAGPHRVSGPDSSGR
ncbi:2,3-bisphosphoglycerate-independent phosphoglycerate mutase [Escherichia coli]|uniref:2,3-bisphosphoglycerate-independent phosphoglycerate mutase n=1 Tax=Escherichia coli TaxID=562 RepID=A0A484Y6H9_ECOLX|nr:2,3-bisphosphoglycerate-independent phosphoglycerate mutase [Escherichia coli]